MVELDSVVLDNNIEYLILTNVEVNGIVYYLLSNVNDDKDIKIGKKMIENNEKYFCSIDDEEELKQVLEALNSKLNG